MNPYVRPNIARMQGYVPGEQPQHAKFIKLNTNENPFAPSQRALDAICQAATDRLTRYPDPLATPFRVVVAEQLGVDPDWILCGNGSDDLLTICTRTFVGEGDWIRFPEPSYVLYRTLADIQGAQWETQPFDSDWTPSTEFAQPRPGLKLAFLPNPNSPTGTWVAPEVVLSIAERLSCPLIVDEAYADFAEASCVPLVEECDRIIVTRTLSKSYGLAGLRFGYLVAQPTMIEQFVKVKDSYNCDAISIAGATAAVLDRAWLAQNVARVVANREALCAGLESLGFAVLPSRSNFVWCEHPHRESRELYEELKRRGILVRFMEYPAWRTGLRISVGTEAQQEVLLQALSEILAA